MQFLLPPSCAQAHLQPGVLDRPSSGLPELVVHSPDEPIGRRSFLKAASLALAGFGAHNAWAAADRQQLIFAPEGDPDVGPGANSPVMPQEAPPAQTLSLGEIPSDFWYRPRELWLRRNGTREETRLVYWKDGQLVQDGYWRACALLRDVRANMMTAVDPAILDVLRGLTGYYQAWRWPHPVVITSGYRTQRTNDALSKEGSAKNSMHLYGRAVDVVVPGVPARDVGALAMSMRQGGVGFYPSKHFTHADTGRLRTWVSR